MGFLGHTITGVAAGICWWIGMTELAMTLSALVMVRQTVSWFNKRDMVGRDMKEHIQALVATLIVWAVYSLGWLRWMPWIS